MSRKSKQGGPSIDHENGDAVATPTQDRENPDKLTGAALRELAHRKGMARSSLPSMSDDKIREQLRYLVHRQYENAVE